MTFQVVLIGGDGYVLGSDTKMVQIDGADDHNSVSAAQPTKRLGCRYSPQASRGRLEPLAGPQFLPEGFQRLLRDLQGRKTKRRNDTRIDGHG